MPVLRSRQRRGSLRSWLVVAALTLLMSLGAPARAQDPLLEETVGFTGGAGWFGIWTGEINAVPRCAFAVMQLVGKICMTAGL